jgi:hypothetical protein
MYYGGNNMITGGSPERKELNLLRGDFQKLYGIICKENDLECFITI